MTKFKITIKNNDTKARYLLLPHKQKDHDDFLKKIKVDTAGLNLTKKAL